MRESARARKMRIEGLGGSMQRAPHAWHVKVLLPFEPRCDSKQADRLAAMIFGLGYGSGHVRERALGTGLPT